MKNQKWRKLGYLFMTTLVLGSSGLGAGLAFAEDGGTTPSVADIHKALADNTSKRKVIIHKFKADDVNALVNRDTGDLNDSVALDKVAGVKFKITRLKPDADGNYPAVTNPLKDQGKYELETDASKYIQEGTTDTDGTITFDLGTGQTADGVYLVEETDTSNATVDGKPVQITKPADPFFVIVPQTKRDSKDTLLYEVNVYPKNIPNDLNPDKTIEGHKAYSVKAGEIFQWEGTINVPKNIVTKVSANATYKQYTWAKDGNGNYKKMDDGSGEYEYKNVTVTKESTIFAQELGMDDSIDANLEVITKATAEDASNPKNYTHMEYLDKDNNWQVLDEKYYKLDIKATTGQPTVVKSDINGSTAADGSTDGANGAMQFLADAGAQKVRTVYVTKAIKDYKGGVIDNWIKPRFRTPNVPPFTPKDTPPDESHTPEIPNGGFDIKKTAADITDDKSTPKDESALKGAVFGLAESEDEAKAGTFIASTTTGDDGTAGFYGLPFMIDDKDAKTGTKIVTTKVPRVDESGKPVYVKDKDGKDTTTQIVDTKRVYSRDLYIVETKAPDGYELVKSPIKVTMVTEATFDGETNRIIPGTVKGTYQNVGYGTNNVVYEASVVDKPKTDLPFTGGEGLVKLVLAAAGIGAVGVVGIYMTKKKDEEKQA